MKKLLEKLGIIKEEKGVTLYSGTGHIQGAGFNFVVDYLYIFGVRFLTHAYVDVEPEWTVKMSKRFSDNWIQEKAHLDYVLKRAKEQKEIENKAKKDGKFYKGLIDQHNKALEEEK